VRRLSTMEKTLPGMMMSQGRRRRPNNAPSNPTTHYHPPAEKWRARSTLAMRQQQEDVAVAVVVVVGERGIYPEGKREKYYGAERFEDDASRINKSDMFYGDDGTISDADLEHIDEVTMKNVQYVKMERGDVVLLDNYKCMHGRNVFDGTRKHGEAWFEGWEVKEDVRRSRRKEEAAVPFYATSL